MKSARSESEIFADLEKLCSSSGYIHALSYFSWRDNFITYAPEGMTAGDILKSYNPSRLLRTEISTLIGLMVKSPIDFGLPDPDAMQTLIDGTQTLLEELHISLSKPFFESFTRKNTAAGNSPFNQADVLREPIFYGGESAYSFQYRDFSKTRYSKDQDWLLANRGFDIEIAHAVVHAIQQLQDRKMVATTKLMRKSDPATWTFLPGLTFSIQEVAAESGLGELQVGDVLRAFTLPVSPTNWAFQSLGDFNLTNACPLIAREDGTLISLQLYSLVETLYDSPFYWMQADENYRSIASANRGLFAEELVAERIRSVFGESNVFANIDIFSGKDRLGEIDIMVAFADRAIIFQCKSKKLNLESRKGNDLLLQADFKKAVQEAYDQGLKCAKALESQDVVFKKNGGETVEFSKFKEIYICTVVSEHYPALSVQSRQFLNFEVSKIIHPPLVADVFFIDVVSEMLSSPLRFLSYINQRALYLEKVTSINEITVLGYHLKQNLWLGDDMDMVMIADDFGIDVDLAMTVRREGIQGVATPPGILTRFQNTTIGRIIKSIESAPEPALVDLGFLLLTVGENALSDMTNGIDQIARQTRADGKCHDITVGFDNGKTGLTVHCSAVSNSEAADKLHRHCRLRKYTQKADSWFGLSVRASDGMPKFGLKLQDAWKQDSEFDNLTRGMSKASNALFEGGRVKHIKVGRNDLCPCGSGLKYKKCCL